MNQSLSREVLMVSLFVLLSAFVGLGPASAQEDDYLDGDVPEWLEEFGYEDTHDDGPVAEDAAEPVEGVSQSAAPRTAASPSGQCDCLRCRNRLTGDWCGYRSCLQQERNRLPRKSHPVLLRCWGWCQPAGSGSVRRAWALPVVIRLSTRVTPAMISSWTWTSSAVFRTASSL